MLQAYFDNENFNKKFKVYFRSRPIIPVAEMDYESTPIPQSNTTLTKKLGYLPTEFDLDFNYVSLNEKAKLRDITNWLTGKKILHFSDDPDVYRIIKKLNIVDVYNDLEELIGFTVALETEPFWFEDKETVTVSSSTTIHNPSVVAVDAALKIYGSGTCSVTVNNNKMKFNSVNEYISVEQKNAHRNGVNQNNNMIGKYPVFVPGENTITISDGTTRVEVNVRWAYR